MTEPSGVSYWHRVVDATGANSGAGSAQTIAQTELTKHKLSDKAELKSTKTDPASGYTVFHYEKNYDNLGMTDKASITALGASTPVCSVTPTTLMNYIDIYVTPNGYFQKLMNKTRQVLESYPVKRATLEESLNEYQSYLPIDPIVIGGTDATGDVTIDEAVLTSIGGTCPSGDSPGTGLTLGLPGTPIGGCFGGLVDWLLYCTDSSGLQVCGTGGSEPTDKDGKNDPFGVCKNGPQTRSATLDLPNGSDPCVEYMKQYSPDTQQIKSGVSSLYKGGPVQCKYTGSPC